MDRQTILPRAKPPGHRQAPSSQEMPGAEVMVWSDMFDPTHDAVDNDYLVIETWNGSWEGFDESMNIYTTWQQKYGLLDEYDKAMIKP